MTATVKTRVTLTLEVSVGSFGDEWTVGSLNKDAKRAVDTALGHLTNVCATNAGMRISDIDTRGLVVIFDRE
jgi:hypothetical protein